MAKSQNKTVENDLSVRDFLDSVANEKRRHDAMVIDEMMHRITGENAVMWGSSIVGFGRYHYKYDSGREGDFMKVGYSPRKQALTLYIMPGFERYDALMAKLGTFKTGKSCLYVKRLDDVDEDVLRDMISASIEHLKQRYA